MATNQPKKEVKGIQLQLFDPRQECARLLVGHSTESARALKLMEEAPFSFVKFDGNGTKPLLKFCEDEYCGDKEIGELIAAIKAQLKGMEFVVLRGR